MLELGVHFRLRTIRRDAEWCNRDGRAPQIKDVSFASDDGARCRWKARKCSKKRKTPPARARPKMLADGRGGRHLGRVHLAHLRLRDFRNYARLDVDFGPGFHVLLGDNAQGKTNILEANYLMAPLRSFRRVCV